MASVSTCLWMIYGGGSLESASIKSEATFAVVMFIWRADQVEPAKKDQIYGSRGKLSLLTRDRSVNMCKLQKFKKDKFVYV